MLKALAILLLLLMLALGMTLGAFNVEPATVDLIITQFTLPLSALLAAALACGLLVGCLLGLIFSSMPQHWRRRRAERALQKRGAVRGHD